MKKNTRETGDAAEQIARAYLIKKGYQIIDTNWQFGHLELDIVARDGDELVIVEVKSRIGKKFDHPLDAISEKKMLQVIEAAEGWIQINDWNKNTRFDLIIVTMTYSGSYELEHYDNAFNPTA